MLLMKQEEFELKGTFENLIELLNQIEKEIYKKASLIWSQILQIESQG
ncbi:unnamed protein product [Paramecium octaurelia]|uniref:Uncharacterized protein n=1 Tax=Paramecium octaurelia TaxID=43137 RepID=A0A8S1W9Q5_PAROT|nr:unnamed protein product [Paramecium octaurelia]